MARREMLSGSFLAAARVRAGFNLTRLISILTIGSAQGNVRSSCQSAGLMTVELDLYLISVAARMLGMHPQTLRKYDRLGLVRPSRTIGSMRLYSQGELARLKMIKRLVDDGGINLAGVQRLLSIAEVVDRIRPLMQDEALSPHDARRLSQELGELSRMLGMDD